MERLDKQPKKIDTKQLQRRQKQVHRMNIKQQENLYLPGSLLAPRRAYEQPATNSRGHRNAAQRDSVSYSAQNQNPK